MGATLEVVGVGTTRFRDGTRGRVALPVYAVWMKTILILTAVLIAAAPAHAWTKRLTVAAGDTVRWETPQTFVKTDNVGIRIWVNGREVDDAAYGGNDGCQIGYARPRVLVHGETSCKRRSGIRWTVDNLRRRKVRVRIGYWIKGPRPAPGDEVEKTG